MVKKVNGQEFENEAMKAPAAVVDFSATWCGPCRMMAPVLEEISEKLGWMKYRNWQRDTGSSRSPACWS